MAFILKQSDSYSWPVEFKIPTEGGRYAKQSFTVELRRVPSSEAERMAAEFQAFFRAAEVGIIDDEIRKPADMARDLVVGWDGITDADGDPIKYSAATLNQLLEVHGAASAIMGAWVESLSGARQKTSAAL